ncbi:cation:proton antiporter [Phycicoccus sp. CSK15P-2]|uniref:cation:proton antiporter domain-containing protein n=1 Tax=Phycicoccus sp. CSK15P-2 TaxID=2807627 RepID=UPI0019510F0E|nr:cation:proton antiporter [Phycicoccus sp. CSK15P-2]MBM6403417.1 cation:proton antiporter [Phycicoccus sp. CSK15P-2]
MSPTLVYVLLGAALLLAAALPQVLHRWALSAPIVLVVGGMLVGLLPATENVTIDPVALRPWIEHLAEVAVLVALMGVGLALDRPLRPRLRASWGSWSPTWRLLGVTMPLTIAGVALLAWGPLGVALPAAVLLGAVLAPTDPVLASDVQVQGPTLEDATGGDDIDEDDEVRFALTSEAGLNDGLAFPFVWAAVFLAAGAPIGGVWRWLGWELVGKVVLGVVVGAALGWLLARLAFRAPARRLRLAETGQPLLSLAALLLAYGLAEAVHGYGFLAVFTCAVTLRSVERHHEYHRHMHEVVERLEVLLTLILLLGLGFAFTNGLFANLDWRGVVVGVALVAVIRPVAGYVAYLGHRTRRGTAGLDHRERLVVGFFGVRGIGSIYYLAFAAGTASFTEERWMWSTVGFTIALSVLVHGVLATPAMRWLDTRRGVPSAA